MLDAILEALRAREELAGWSVRQIMRRGAQLFAVPNAVEARRSVASEHYVVDVMRQTSTPGGSRTVGTGDVTLLPGDHITSALDAAVLMAGLVHNPLYSLPAPAALPDVSMTDPELQEKAAETLDRLLSQLRAAVAGHPRVRLTAAELFAEEETTRLVNSRGIDASQTGTLLHFETVLLSREHEREVESFAELSRRRLADLDLEAEVQRHARYAVDLLDAGAPSPFSGPVVLRGSTLGTFMNGGTLQTLASGAAKFGKTSSWEIGHPVFRPAVEGDPLTVFANRQLPFGTGTNRFDAEGIPAQRVTLIRDNVLQTFVADQRHADYLGIAPSGHFGNVELPPGSAPARLLLEEPYVEIVAFSWFNPNRVTGEFSSEIRLGYRCEGGRRTPFRGGALVGNVLDALANVRWSSETGFYGDYQGPTTARFANLTIAGGES